MNRISQSGLPAIVLFACCELAWTDAGAAGADFSIVGDLPGGRAFSQVFDISDNGDVAVGVSDATSGQMAFRWTRSAGIEALGHLQSGAYSSATGVSADGQIVVGAATVNAPQPDLRAFRWSADRGLIALASASAAPFASRAMAISADGQTIVGWTETASGFEAVQWSGDDAPVGLGVLPIAGYSSQAMGVSGNGSVIAGLSGTPRPTTEAFVWTTANGINGLGDLPSSAFFSQAFAVSDDGKVVVGRANPGGGPQAFRWSNATGMQGLGDLPGGRPESWALAVSADGRRVTGVSQTEQGPTAFVWDAASGMIALQELLTEQGVALDGWYLAYASSISADGRTIAGTAVNPEGDRLGFVATLGDGN